MLPHNTLGRQQLTQAQGLRRPRAPARGAAAGAVRDHPGRPVSTADDRRQDRLEETVEHRRRDRRLGHRVHLRVRRRPSPASRRGAPCSPPPAPRPAAARRPSPASASSPAPASGRSTAARSRTTSRTRSTSSSSTSRSRLLELDGAYDVIARIHGGGVSGQAGALRLGIARALNGIDEEQPPAAEEGRLPDP